MNNPFKEILNDEKLPDEIKKRVMADIARLKNSTDITDLLLVKYPDIFSDIVDNKEIDSSKVNLDQNLSK
ncbi:hypothetical protein ACHRVK_20895 [Flavobacterium plurextorum]|uniref:Uncharacterized protein n=1 Tax=Flavobacterium plurextorum TaxID=1114867 RepID=A0ABX4CWS5_9FLAO|nr:MULTISPECIES: hypothetical protein [Flavobacterium]OXB08650.1 hypothetical protein B0A81_10130 [Flavobacterium plurextorum]UUW07580.1 hypothetical protein NLG42_15880 [Flavobacterium plurextorum]